MSYRITKSKLTLKQILDTSYRKGFWLISVNDSKNVIFLNQHNQLVNLKHTNYLHIKYYLEPNFNLKNSIHKFFNLLFNTVFKVNVTKMIYNCLKHLS